MGSEYPDAVDMFLPTYYSFTSNAHKAIVQHSTGGNMTVQSVYNTFLATMRSAHFAIGLDGTVAQFVPLSRGAGGNCCPDGSHNSWWDHLIAEYPNLNLCTISIEHCNNASQSLVMTQAQMDASNRLTRWLVEKYGLSTGDIWGHDSINATGCPGKAFYDTYWSQMMEYVKNGGTTVIDLTTPHVSDFFEAVPGNNYQWKCKQTGAIIGHGMLTAYQGYGNSALCGLSFLGLPKSGEIAIDPVRYPGAVKQYFERGCLVYDPSHLIDNPPGAGNVYAAHVYDGGPGQDPAFTQLQGVYGQIYADRQQKMQQIAQLQAQLQQLQGQTQASPQLLTDMQQILANSLQMEAIARRYPATG